MNCPGCEQPMSAETLEAQLERVLTVDVCARCQLIWFDPYEDLQLAPASVLRLFRIIGETSQQSRPPSPGRFACPHCGRALVYTHDLQRTTRFAYWRCPAGNGRLIGFYDFLREKDFVRPLSADQVAAITRDLEAVNCANCGAPVDLRRDSVCPHCGSALSLVDLRHAEALIASLKEDAKS